MSTKIAVIPKPPVLLDRAKTIETALESIAEAAGKGASLLVFPEAYIPGYPAWIWRLSGASNPAATCSYRRRFTQGFVRMPSISKAEIYSRFKTPRRGTG